MFRAKTATLLNRSLAMIWALAYAGVLIAFAGIIIFGV